MIDGCCFREIGRLNSEPSFNVLHVLHFYLLFLYTFFIMKTAVATYLTDGRIFLDELFGCLENDCIPDHVLNDIVIENASNLLLIFLTTCSEEAWQSDIIDLIVVHIKEGAV